MPTAFEQPHGVIQTYRHTDGRILTEVGTKNQSFSREATPAERDAFLKPQEAAPVAPAHIAAPEAETHAVDPLAAPEPAKRGPGRPKKGD